MKQILDFVREHGCWQEAPINGLYDNIPFTGDDYHRFTKRKLETLEFHSVKGAYFPTTLAKFTDSGTTFIIRKMVGQGTEIDIFTLKHFKTNFPDQLRKSNVLDGR